MPGPERWLADEVDLSAYAWNISAQTLSVPALRGSNLEMPMRDGFIHVPNRASSPGEVSLSMWVLGANPDGSTPGVRSSRRALFEKNLHFLLGVLTNRSRTIRLRRYLASNTVFREAQVAFSDSISVATMMARQRAEFTAVFEIVDSFWRSGASVTQSITGNASTGLDLLMFGAEGMSAPVQDAVVTVTGPIAQPEISNPESGVWVRLGASLAAGEQWVVDSGAWTSKRQGITAPATTHGGHPRYVYIAPRSGMSSVPRLRLRSLASSGSGATISATFYPRWATL